MQKLLLLLFTLLALPLAAQFQLQPAFRGEDGLYLEELEQVQLTNTSGAVRQLRLRVEVRDEEGGLLYTKESLPFTLEAGSIAPVQQVWKGGKQAFVAPALETQLRADNALPQGQYEICVLVLDAVNKTAAFRQCRWTTVAAAEVQPNRLQTSGNVQLSYRYAKRQWYGSTLPPSYWQVEAHPTFSWEGIPVGLDLFWTNEDNRFGRPMDAVSLRFDVQAFQARLRQQLQAKLSEKRDEIQQRYQPELAAEANLQQVLTQTEHVDTNLLYQWLPQAEARLDSLQEMTGHYADSLVTEIVQQQDSLFQEQQVHLAGRDSLLRLRTDLEKRVKQLRQHRRQYQQLLQRKAYLENKWQHLQAQNDSLPQIDPPDIAQLSPQQFKSMLLENQLLESGKTVLLSIEQLQLGAYYLDYTPLAFNGSQINGVNIAFRPAPKWTISLAGGKIQTPQFADSLFAAQPAPYTLANKLSWKVSQHLAYYLGGIYTWEKGPTPEGATARNWILTTGWQWRLPKINSQWTVDIAKNGGLRNTSTEAMAWETQFSGSFLNSRLQLDGKWQKIGSLYQDFGSPFLRSGMEIQEVQLNSQWWKDRLQVGLFYQRDHNRPLGYSPFQLQNHQLGGRLQLNVPKGPQATLQLGYNLLDQSEQQQATYLYHAYLQQSWKLGNRAATSKVLLQYTQQQWHPLLPPSLYQYREFRQQLQISEQWSVEWVGYQTYEQLNQAVPKLTYTSEQAFSGMDMQQALSFSNGNYLHLLVGFYQYHQRPAMHWKAQLSTQLAIQSQLFLKVTAAWGQLPNLTATYDQSFLNIGLQWQW